MLISCTVSYAQKVQNTFFGSRFGDTNISVRSKLDENNVKLDTVNINSNNVETFKIQLGGYIFNYSDWRFYEDQLYEVSFTSSYKSSTEAKQWYQLIVSSLLSKYPKLRQKKDECGSVTNSYYDKNTYIILSLEKLESKGSSLRNYITLTYTDLALYSEQAEKEKSEL